MNLDGKSIKILVSLNLLVALSCQPNASEYNKQSSLNFEKKGLVIGINKYYFQDHVWDFVQYPYETKFVGNRPCLVYFSAVWCQPCQRVAPLLDELAKKYQEKIDFYKVDIEKEPAIAKALNIKTIPSFWIFSHNKRTIIQDGILPKNTATIDLLEQMISEATDK